VVAVPEMDNDGIPGRDEKGTATLFFQRLTIVFGAGTVFISILGLASIYWNLGIYRFFYPDYKTIAFSAALIWIVSGLILAFQVKKPFRGRIRACILAVIVVIAIFALIEFPLQLLGQSFIIETWLYQFGNAILAYPTTPISPVAAGLMIPSSLALFLLVYVFGSHEKIQDARSTVGILGIFVVLVSFTFLLSYIYGIPFLYETSFLPLAPESTITLLLLGAGFITAAGPDAAPLKYFTGNSTKAHLLRTFVPLVIILIFAQSFLQATFFSVYTLNSALSMALFLVAVTIVTTYVVGKVSGSLSNAIDSAEHHRRAAEEQYRALFGNVNIGILRSTPGSQGSLVEVNPAAIRIFEADSREQLLAVPPSALYFNPEQRRLISDEIVAKGSIKGMEVRYRTLNGKPIWARITATKKTSETGEIWFDSTIEDITEQKQAVEALQESERKYRNLYQYAQVGLFETSLKDGTVVACNERYATLAGFLSAEDAIGNDIVHLYMNTDDRKEVSRILHTEGHIDDHIVQFKNHVTGRPFWTQFSARLNREEDRAEGTIIDITAQKESEAALRESEELFKGVAERSSDLILLVNKRGIATYVSPSVERILGYLPDEIVGKTPEDFIIPDDITAVWEGVNKSVSGEYIGGVTVHSRKKSGEYAIMEMTSSPIIKEDRISGIQVIARDITDRKVVEYQRELLISELEQKNAELERFTYTVSHDLKSPIITIRGFLGLLAEDVKKGDIDQMDSDIRRIFSATDKMQGLLEDLLTLSRIGRITNPPESINFGTIAEEAAEQLAGVIRKHDVTVTIAPDLPDVFVDHTRIREVLVNLIENAIKFRGDQPVPTIEIGMRCDEREPIFFVKDNGIGIEEPYTKRIFVLFEKLDAKTEGTGVGLAIVKRIIEVHGGKIWAESPGRGLGSTFSFTLPVTESKCIYIPKKGKRDE
jgi:PAS domain S-box-containing protein